MVYIFIVLLKYDPNTKMAQGISYLSSPNNVAPATVAYTQENASNMVRYWNWKRNPTGWKMNNSSGIMKKRINWLRIARPYRRVWWWKPSSLNNCLNIKLFAIQKHRTEWLRKLTNRHRSTSCNQNLSRRTSKNEKTRADSETGLLKRKGKIKFSKKPRICRHI